MRFLHGEKGIAAVGHRQGLSWFFVLNIRGGELEFGMNGILNWIREDLFAYEAFGFPIGAVLAVLLVLVFGVLFMKFIRWGGMTDSDYHKNNWWGDQSSRQIRI